MLTEVAEAMLARHELAPFLALAPRWAAYRFQCHHNLPGLAPKDVFMRFSRLIGQIGISVKRTNVSDICFFRMGSLLRTLLDSSLRSKNNRDSNRSAVARLNTSNWPDCFIADSKREVSIPVARRSRHSTLAKRSTSSRSTADLAS